MQRSIVALLVVLVSHTWSCSTAVKLPATAFAMDRGPLQTARASATAPVESTEMSDVPGTSPQGPVAVHSNTTRVESITGRGTTLWVATRGGLEEYDLVRRERVAVYTTRDGLPTLFVTNVALAEDGLPVAITGHHRCTMRAPRHRFTCVPHSDSTEGGKNGGGPPTRRAPTPQAPFATASERIEGAPVTAHFRGSDGREWLGTAGLGVWERAPGVLRRLTPTNQIVSNHIVAIAEWKQSTYFASFDAGLGRVADGAFSTLGIASKLLNDVVATPDAVYVASSDGLYVSRDGEHFRRDARVTERFVSDLAYDAPRNRLYATATGSLWELDLGAPSHSPRSVYLPGGSRSLQAVDVSRDGTVFLATEDRGVLRRIGRRHFTTFDRLAGYPSSWATDVLALDSKSALFGSLRNGVFPVGGGAADVSKVADSWILFLGRDPRDPERLFVGTQGGGVVIDGEIQRELEGLPNPCVHVIAQLSTGLWVGTEGGLAQYP